jgi:hypothetical protein
VTAPISANARARSLWLRRAPRTATAIPLD